VTDVPGPACPDTRKPGDLEEREMPQEHNVAEKHGPEGCRNACLISSIDARTAEKKRRNCWKQKLQNSPGQTPLSTADCLPEMEVLSTIRDLGGGTYRVTVGSTEGWKKLESS
jgi:hypothetical protein